jgi:5-carboxymethyl-2-hydroxymuconate isomerase
MPHVIIEYSSNLRESLKPEEFIKAVHKAAMSTGDFAPSAILRTRAAERTSFLVGDGHPDNGFIHIVMRIRAGRDREIKRKLGENVFSGICEYLKPLFDTRRIGLTFEIEEIDADFRWLKSSNFA